MASITFYNSDTRHPGKLMSVKHIKDLKLEHPVLVWATNIKDHHPMNQGKSTVSLTSKKSGGGFGILAGKCYKEGIPTLGLPSCQSSGGVGKVHREQAEHAVRDLWKAIGGGYDLVIPVRQHINETYFTTSINVNGEQAEPSLWGQNNTTQNTDIGDYYIKQLIIIEKYMNNPTDDNVPQEFMDAYRFGQTNWAVKISSTDTRATAPADDTIAKPKPQEAVDTRASAASAAATDIGGGDKPSSSWRMSRRGSGGDGGGGGDDSVNIGGGNNKKSSSSFVMRVVEVIALAILAALFIIIGIPHGPSLLLSFSITLAFDRIFMSHTSENSPPPKPSSTHQSAAADNGTKKYKFPANRPAGYNEARRGTGPESRR